jgi:hypothetical protein
LAAPFFALSIRPNGGLFFTFQILLCTIVVLWDLQIPEVSNPIISFGVCAEIWMMDQIHKG